MNLRLIVAVSAVAALTATARGPQDAATDADGTWVGTITTEGNVTTVVNESGSVWGGAATLVEEASIGVDVGADEYMLGTVSSVAATDDTILVADMQVPAVRIYDYEGRYLRDLGAPGEGPGEYGFPDSIAIAPDGRIFLRDRGPSRITAFLPDGTVDQIFQVPGRLVTGTPIVVTPEGVPYSPQRTAGGDSAVWRMGMTPFGRNGPVGDPIAPPQIEEELEWLAARRADGSARSSSPVPFAPTLAWAMAPNGTMIAGMPTEYRFEIRQPEGPVIVVVSNRNPVSVLAEEAAWHERRLTAWFRRRTPEWTWDGPPIPETKPPFSGFVLSQSGEIWVLGAGLGERAVDCTEDPQPGEDVVPCWTDSQIVDVFGTDGRYLGNVDLPEGVRLGRRPWIKGRTVIAANEDEAGTIMVKRYWLVLPGER